MSEDAARDGTNWYVYANNNPLVFIDPTGNYAIGGLEYAISELLAGIAGIVGFSTTPMHKYQQYTESDFEVIRAGLKYNKSRTAGLEKAKADGLKVPTILPQNWSYRFDVDGNIVGFHNFQVGSIPLGDNPWNYASKTEIKTARQNLFSPEDFGLTSIAEDSDYFRIWTNTLRDLEKGNNKYSKLLNKIDNSSDLTNKELDDTFKYVRRTFKINAESEGLELSQDVQLHHWNYPKVQFPTQVFDPRNIFITKNRLEHTTIHKLTTSTSNIWRGPILPDLSLHIPYDYKLPDSSSKKESTLSSD